MPTVGESHGLLKIAAHTRKKYPPRVCIGNDRESLYVFVFSKFLDSTRHHNPFPLPQHAVRIRSPQFREAEALMREILSESRVRK
jgi:hypothetical protein